ncbi:hypothetical protein QL996_13410 [Planococcus sp. APC 4015]|nr:hypothetical protein [Planococcus sp. APC 4015]
MEGLRLKLDHNEALVLFDWLARFNKTGEATFVDQAEQRVLSNIEAALESELIEPFDPDYASMVAAARARVRDLAS